MVTLPPALSAMAAYDQFVVYKLVPSERIGKTDKLPVDWRTGQLPSKGAGGNKIWTSAATAMVMSQMYGSDYGVGFSFAESDPFWFLDIDNCLLPDGSGWSKTALDLCASLSGAAIEISQSKKGLHIFGTGVVPPHVCKNQVLGLEFYHTDRFAALTGLGATGDAATDFTQNLSTLVNTYFAPSPGSNAAPLSAFEPEWTTEPCDEWRGPADDDALIARMLASRPSTAAVFGGKATLQQLWERDVTALAASYPSTSASQAYGESEADAALASHLLWWVGKDCARTERLMQRSALRRDKWEREDYLRRTILGASRLTGSVYQERQADTPPEASGSAPTTIPTTGQGRMVNGHTFVTAEDQLVLWAGFTYVTDANAILTNTGQLFGPDQFKNRYGGSVYIMSNDNGAGSTTKNAWEAFTHSQAVRMPKVDHSAFRPDLPPGEVWERDDESFVNTYRALNIARTPGDAAPFLNHLAKLLPNPRDRTILLSYMAAIVQFPGIKFQWAPLIQGVEGNGKTLFSRCVAEAVGMRYSHMPRASELAEKFNDWLVGKIFIGVEDVYYPEGRTEIIETLKPMITNSRLPIRAMRSSERTMDVCANFIVNSNHKDAIRKTTNDRRWCVMFTAQQHAEDLERDGMVGDYFPRLYDWLRDGGYAVVTEYLHTYAIPAEFGMDCLLSRAPLTSSTEEAVACGLGRVEQEVVEAIQAGHEGFGGGWVSSSKLDEMLKLGRMDGVMPRAKRRGMMQALGFDWHPSLQNGRLSVLMPGTGERPVLFIRKDHPSAKLATSQEILRAYQAAQTAGVSSVLGVFAGGGVV